MLNIGNAFKVSYRRASSLTLMSSYYDFNSQSLTLILRLLGKRKPRKQDKPASGVPSTPTNKCSPSPCPFSKRKPRRQNKSTPGPYHNAPVGTLRQLYQTSHQCQDLCVSSCAHAPTCVYAPSPNPLNSIEGPTLERAARGGPLQLSTRTPSPPSTPPHWIKFVNAPSHQFPLDFLP